MSVISKGLCGFLASLFFLALILIVVGLTPLYISKYINKIN
jgi:hypothetical protein